MKHIIKELRTHMADYLLLVSAGVCFLVLLLGFKGQRVIEYFTVIGFAGFYILWALYHHGLQKSIRFKNMLEYILIAVLVLIIIKIAIFI